MFEKTWAKVVAVATIITIVAGLITICDKVNVDSTPSNADERNEEIIEDQSVENNTSSNDIDDLQNNEESTEKKVDNNAPIYLLELDYFSADINGSACEVFEKNTPIKINTGEEYISYICNGLYCACYLNGNVQYLLNTEYTRFTGIYAIKFDGRDSSMSNTPIFTVYLDDRLVYTETIEQGSMPIEFDIDVTGCKMMTIEFKYFGGPPVIANLQLWK